MDCTNNNTECITSTASLSMVLFFYILQLITAINALASMPIQLEGYYSLGDDSAIVILMGWTNKTSADITRMNRRY